MIKLFIGILKGSVLGGLIGYGAYAAQFQSEVLAWVTYAVIGALVGLVVGKPIWSVLTDKNATSFASILKAIVGAGIGVGLYALARKFLGFEVPLTFLEETARPFHAWPMLMGAAVGGLWGGLIELDDAFDDPPPSQKKLDKPRG